PMVLSSMGGLHLTENEWLVYRIASWVSRASCWLFPVWLIGAVVASWRTRPDWKGPRNRGEKTASPSRGVWVLAVASVVVWILIVPFTQPAVILQTQVEKDLKAGRIAEALDLMSAHQPADFPPHWDPPPIMEHAWPQPGILDIMEVMISHPPAQWVRERF